MPLALVADPATPAPPLPEPRPGWQLDAACSPGDDVLYFAERGYPGLADTGLSVDEALEQGRALCGTCPVQGDCLSFGVWHGGVHGMWGGRDQDELDIIRVQVGAPRTMLQVPIPINLFTPTVAGEVDDDEVELDEFGWAA